MTKPELSFVSQRIGISAIAFPLVLAVALVFHMSSLRERLDAAALDAMQRIARALGPYRAVEDVVIVGIDEETERQFSEPFALWHRHFGALLSALARGNSRLIALDVVLPERSYDSLVPGLDAALIQGLVAAKRSNQLVVSLTLDSQGRPRRIDDLFLAALGLDSLGMAYVVVDSDGTARRIAHRTESEAGPLPLLTERIAARLGLGRQGGLIDFACGQPLSYVSMNDVIAWGQARHDLLSKTFGGKIVLVGKVGPDEDPVRQPLSLAVWAPTASAPPGVVLLAQSVRALQSGRILSELPGWALFVLVAGCAAVVALHGLWRIWAVAGVILAGIAVLVLTSYWIGIVVLPTSPIAAVMLGAILRSTVEALEQRRRRLAIEQRFGGYVSENLLAAILSGELDPSKPKKYDNLGFLFADLRGFTTMTERLPPEQVLALLNRYYEAITPAIHLFDGTIDNFRGDGILAIFGAPRSANDGPRRAGLAAREMFLRLQTLNLQLVRDGHNELQMGIGLAAGDAVAGNVGSSVRHGYTAVGDAVNVAARLQSLCKPLKMKIVASEAIARICSMDLPFISLGPLELAGHAPVKGFGVPLSSENVTQEMSATSLDQSSNDL